jgi:serine palmitoyltransferase
MAPLLAVSSSEAISFLCTPTTPSGTLPLSNQSENVHILRKVLDKIDTIEIPSDISSPLIHIRVRETTENENDNNNTRDDQERLLQDVADECLNNGVLVTRQKRVWEQEIVHDGRPSIRLCVSAALPRKEVEKAAQVIKAAVVKVLGKKRRRPGSP